MQKSFNKAKENITEFKNEVDDANDEEISDLLQFGANVLNSTHFASIDEEVAIWGLISV